MKRYLTGRNLILAAIVLVLVLLAWSAYKARKRVLDPSNDAGLSGVFDALNPGVVGTVTRPSVNT
jgi:hypothetical protein